MGRGAFFVLISLHRGKKQDGMGEKKKKRQAGQGSPGNPRSSTNTKRKENSRKKRVMKTSFIFASIDWIGFF